MSQRCTVLTLTTLLTIAAAPASPASLSYQVTVNTSSQSGNYGYIDLQLNPGLLISEPVEADLLGFAGAGLNPLDSNNANFGDVTGSLPASLTIRNTKTNQTNDAYEGLTFGSSITFLLTLSGAGVDPFGNAAGTSGTVFLFDFIDASQSQYLFTNDPGGTSTSATDPLWAAGVISIDNTGRSAIYSNQTIGGGPSVVTFVAVPEPATFAPLGVSLLWLCFVASRLHRNYRAVNRGQASSACTR